MKKLGLQAFHTNAGVARQAVLVLALAQWFAACAATPANKSGVQSSPPTAASSPAAAALPGNAPSVQAGGGSGAPAVTQPKMVMPVGMAGAPAPQTVAPTKSPDAGATPTTTPTVATKPVLFWLDILGNAVWRANADGTEARAIVTGNGISAPDGVTVDLEGGYVEWTNMGSALGGANLGTVQRARLDGSAPETIVPAGVGNTFKQMTIDRVHHKLYWCDREGAKVWRANLDGTQHEVLASGHSFQQLVGIALDVPRAQFYFTDRNAKKILRAGFELPTGQTDATRTDIEELFVLGGNAMPIDLDLDLDKRMIYWTDRQLGLVQRASMDLPAGQTAGNRKDAEMLVSGLSEPIGISLDLENGVMYFGELSAAQVSRANLDGSNRKMIASGTSTTGVTLVHLPTK